MYNNDVSNNGKVADYFLNQHEKLAYGFLVWNDYFMSQIGSWTKTRGLNLTQSLILADRRPHYMVVTVSGVGFVWLNTATGGNLLFVIYLREMVVMYTFVKCLSTFCSSSLLICHLTVVSLRIILSSTKMSQRTAGKVHVTMVTVSSSYNSSRSNCSSTTPSTKARMESLAQWTRTENGAGWLGSWLKRYLCWLMGQNSASEWCSLSNNV